MSNESTDFKITLPIVKSHSDDGGWYITGVAAGVGVDGDNDYITQAAIQNLADQINTGKIPFRNHHNKDSIIEDMGYLVKATISPDWQLKVDVRLDEDNPDAQYLWKKLDQGKQYGMSINGKSIGWYRDIHKSTKRQVIAHNYIVLEEVSATTRPKFTPSLGTVLRKAIDEADVSHADTQGETSDMTTPNTSGEEQVVPQSSNQETDTAQSTLSPSQELVKSLMENNDFVTLIKAAVSETTKVETQETRNDSTETPETPAEGSTFSAENVREIVKSAVTEVSADFTARLEAMMERIPEVATPHVLIKSEEEQTLEGLAQLTPQQRLRAGLAARSGELDRLQ